MKLKSYHKFTYTIQSAKKQNDKQSRNDKLQQVAPGRTAADFEQDIIVLEKGAVLLIGPGLTDLAPRGL